MEAFKVIPGTVQSCSNILKEGNILAIAPGGVYEAQFGNSNYQILWKNRVGFAKVALEAKVVSHLNIVTYFFMYKKSTLVFTACHTHVHKKYPRRLQIAQLGLSSLEMALFENSPTSCSYLWLLSSQDENVSWQADPLRPQ